MKKVVFNKLVDEININDIKTHGCLGVCIEDQKYVAAQVAYQQYALFAMSDGAGLNRKDDVRLSGINQLIKYYKHLSTEFFIFDTSREMLTWLIN